jgi:hypothetical protein
MSLLPSKNDTKIFIIIKFCPFSLDGGHLTILTEARSKTIKILWQKFEQLFDDKKLSMHKMYINKIIQTKIAHVLAKRGHLLFP